MRLFKQRGSKSWYADHLVGGRRFRQSMRTSDKRKAERKAREWAVKLDAESCIPLHSISLSTAQECFLDHCRKARLALRTVAGYKMHLRFFCNHKGASFNVSGWTPDTAFMDVRAYLDHRVENCGVVSDKADRIALSAFFNFLRSKRWYRGENPADAKLHKLRRPRKKLVHTEVTTKDEDLIIRKEGPKYRVWPLLLLARWGGLRRGEICRLLWSEINLSDGYADISGHEGGRKHPRRVWLAPWVVLQLQSMRPGWMPTIGEWPLWPFHVDTATDDVGRFMEEHLKRSIGLQVLRASWVTEAFDHGFTAEEEARFAGHSQAVARKHYDQSQARKACDKLPGDPLWGLEPPSKSDSGAAVS